MAEPGQPVKKIFFNYSDDSEDIVMTHNLCLHFAVLRNKVSLWHKEKIVPGDDREAAMQQNLDDSDATVHLLSIAYENQKECTDILDQSVSQHKKNIPVLLSSLDWESDDKLVQLKDEMLPHDHKPVDIHPNFNQVYTEIVQSVKNDLFNDNSPVRTDQRAYYYILAAIALLAGFFTSIWANKAFGSITVALLVFSMFLVTSLFIMRKVFFPASVSTSKS